MASEGRWGLRLTNDSLGGTAGCWIRSRPFDLNDYPNLEFDYRVDTLLRVDLQCRVNGEWVVVKFTDNDATFPVLGAIADVRRDMEWHGAKVDLLQLARRRFPNDPALVVTGLRFASGGWPGCREGATWYLDNLRMPRVVRVPA